MADFMVLRDDCPKVRIEKKWPEEVRAHRLFLRSLSDRCQICLVAIPVIQEREIHHIDGNAKNQAKNQKLASPEEVRIVCHRCHDLLHKTVIALAVRFCKEHYPKIFRDAWDCVIDKRDAQCRGQQITGDVIKTHGRYTGKGEVGE